MKEIDGYNTNTEYGARVVVEQLSDWTDKATDKINKLTEENKKLKEKVETLEKIIEVLQFQIDEIKKNQEQNQLIAQVEQLPQYKK